MGVLKIRISHGKQTAMGPGKADLLETIHATGSISAAAKKMGMSYRRAWELVNSMNHCFQHPLVTTALGGVQGGGAHITEFGFAILASYRQLELKAAQAAEIELNQILSNLSLTND